MTSYEIAVTAVAGVMILIGIAGTLLPILPGLLLVWGTVVLYGLFVGYGVIGWIAVVLVSVLLAIGLYLNVRIPQRSAAGAGLSVAGQLIGLLLAVIGFFLVPVIGFPFGFVLGVFLVRLRTTHDGAQAWASTKTTMMAMLRASAIQAVCGVGMLVVWSGWAAGMAIT